MGDEIGALKGISKVQTMQFALETITIFYDCKGHGDHLMQLFHCRK